MWFSLFICLDVKFVANSSIFTGYFFGVIEVFFPADGGWV
jgi:hypothetical protein